MSHTLMASLSPLAAAWHRRMMAFCCADLWFQSSAMPAGTCKNEAGLRPPVTHKTLDYLHMSGETSCESAA